MTEICCANCRNKPELKDFCSGNAECWDDNMGNLRRGKYDNYYNHFVPKEDKMFKFVCKQCGKSLEEGTYCTCVPRKEDNVKYKATGKSLTARQVIAKGRTSINDTKSLCSWVDKHTTGTEFCYLDNDLFSAENFLDHALKHTCFRDFLLAGGYIEQVDAWVSPKMGDRFRSKEGTHRLCQATFAAYVLMCENEWNRQEDPVEIKDHDNITKAEFQQICGLIPIDELERI